MTHFQKAPRKPLFTDETEANQFISLFTDFDEENHRKIAKLIFVDGLTNEEVANEIGYSKRQIERLRAQLVKVALKRAIRKLANVSKWG
ncbi:MAG: ECF-type sigma factor [Clostridia bacterium]|nr:ECF-type sigma factor [Clostridia bacterium]